MPNTSKHSARRGRAWRRAQRARVIQTRKGQLGSPYMRPVKHDGELETIGLSKVFDHWHEKNWKLVYTRGAKITRARQLGYLWPYPKKIMDELLDDMLEDIE